LLHAVALLPALSVAVMHQRCTPRSLARILIV